MAASVHGMVNVKEFVVECSGSRPSRGNVLETCGALDVTLPITALAHSQIRGHLRSEMPAAS